MLAPSLLDSFPRPLATSVSGYSQHSPLQTSSLPTIPCPHCSVELTLSQMHSHECIARDLEQDCRIGRNSCRVSPLKFSLPTPISASASTSFPSETKTAPHHAFRPSVSSPPLSDSGSNYDSPDADKAFSPGVLDPPKKSASENSVSSPLGWMAALRAMVDDSDDDGGFLSDGETEGEFVWGRQYSVARRKSRKKVEAENSDSQSKIGLSNPKTRTTEMAQQRSSAPESRSSVTTDRTTSVASYTNNFSYPPSHSRISMTRCSSDMPTSRASRATKSSSGSVSSCASSRALQARRRNSSVSPSQFPRPPGGPPGLRINTVIANAMAKPSSRAASASNTGDDGSAASRVKPSFLQVEPQNRSGTSVTPLQSIPVSPLSAFSFNRLATAAPATSGLGSVSKGVLSHPTSFSRSFSSPITTGSHVLSPSNSVSSTASSATSTTSSAKSAFAPPRPPRPGNGDVDDFIVKLNKKAVAAAHGVPPSATARCLIHQNHDAASTDLTSLRSQTFPPAHGRKKSRTLHRRHKVAASVSSIMSNLSSSSLSGLPRRPHVEEAVEDHYAGTTSLGDRAAVVVGPRVQQRKRSFVAEECQAEILNLGGSSGQSSLESPLPSPAPSLSPSELPLPSPSFRNQFLPKDADSDTEGRDMLRPDQPLQSPVKPSLSSPQSHKPKSLVVPAVEVSVSNPPSLPKLSTVSSLPPSLTIGRPTISSSVRSYTPLTPAHGESVSPVVATFPNSPPTSRRGRVTISPGSHGIPVGWDMRPYGSSYSALPFKNPQLLGPPSSRPGKSSSVSSASGDERSTSVSTSSSSQSDDTTIYTAGPTFALKTAHPTFPIIPMQSSPPVDKTVCMGCHLPLKPADKSAPRKRTVKSADGRLPGRYHADCLVCADCGCKFVGIGADPNTEPGSSAESLVLSQCYIYSGTPLCRAHYHARNGSLCGLCGDGIEGQFVFGPRGRVHVECASRVQSKGHNAAPKTSRTMKGVPH